MKHIFLIFLTIFSFNAFANTTGLNAIKKRGHIICATNLDVNSYYNKDEEGIIKGIDANICKIFSLAIFGNPNSYKMIDANNQNKADVILGGTSNTATKEASTNLAPAALFYYDNLMFMGRTKDNATSMADYKNANVCIAKDALNNFDLEIYSSKYELNFNYLTFNTNKQAKEAFLLNRCKLLSAPQIYLASIQDESKRIIPESIATIPVSVFVAKHNHSLRVAIKWIINALIMAERLNINKQSLAINHQYQDSLSQNLMGDNKKIWQSLGLNPNWLRQAIKTYGNYGEFIEENIGSLNIKRTNNNLIENNGLINGEAFL